MYMAFGFGPISSSFSVEQDFTMKLGQFLVFNKFFENLYFFFLINFYYNFSSTNFEHDEEAKRSLYQSCRKMLKSAKKLLASDHKTLEITPVKSAPKQRSSLPGSQKQTLQLISQ